MDVEPSEVLTGGPGWARLAMKDDIDVNSAPKYRPFVKQVIEQEPRMIVLDLQQVSFMDSSGLGLVADLARACRETKGVVYVVDASDIVKTTLAACGLDQYVTLVASDDEALSGLPRP